VLLKNSLKLIDFSVEIDFLKLSLKRRMFAQEKIKKVPNLTLGLIFVSDVNYCLIFVLSTEYLCHKRDCLVSLMI